MSYLLGKHNWTIQSDVDCGKGTDYDDEPLKLTGCAEDEFTCNNGRCIKMEERCNSEFDCIDC